MTTMMIVTIRIVEEYGSVTITISTTILHNES